MAMRYKFQAAHRIIGLTPPAELSEEVLLKNLAPKERAVLAYELGDHLFELDRSSAIAQLLLKGLIGQREAGTFEDSLKNELGELRTQRNRKSGRDVFLVYEAEGQVPSWRPHNETEHDDFVIAFEGTPKQPIRDRHQAAINGLLASLILASDRVCGHTKVAEDVYFINDENKPVYSYALRLSATPTVSTPLGNEVIDYIQRNARAIEEHKELATAGRLLARSLDQESDALLSFLSAWTGLEIFVNTIFDAYESLAVKDDSSPEEPASPSEHSPRRRKAKHPPLGRKFSEISTFLAPESHDEDNAQFQELKERRNSLVHGEESQFASLPTDRVQALLRKYLILRAAEIEGAT